MPRGRGRRLGIFETTMAERTATGNGMTGWREQHARHTARQGCGAGSMVLNRGTGLLRGLKSRSENSLKARSSQWIGRNGRVRVPRTRGSGSDSV
jgi:hypothetical protein